MRIRTIVIPALLLSNFCCVEKYIIKNQDTRFKVMNNSSKAIYSSRNETTLDTAIENYNPGVSPAENKIEPGEIDETRLFGTNWETRFKNSPTGMMSLFVFSADSIESIPWDTIYKRYLVLKRYDFTLDQIKNRNWIIEYPYDSTLGEIKVWPR